MAKQRIVFDAHVTDPISLADAYADSPASHDLSRTQSALVFSLVKERLPASVVIEQRSPKGPLHLLIAGARVERFHISQRAKIVD